MAAIDTNRTAFGAATLAGRAIHIFAQATGTFAAWNDARVTRKALNALTDRELEDIGMCRGDIELVAQSVISN